MSSHKRNLGINNRDKWFKAILAILEALSDGQWHRNMNLRKETKLSPRILNKHLDKMEKTKIIERKTDVINGKYAVLFKAKVEIIAGYKTYKINKGFIDQLEKVLNEKKDPFIILDTIHKYNTLIFAALLTRIQQNKKITTEEINFLTEISLWITFEQWTSKLIEASYKMINDLNVNELLVKQAIRQIDFHKDLLTTYKKIAKNS